MAKPDLRKAGLNAAMFKKLESMFPYQRPKVDSTLPEIQRREGHQDVLDVIRREFLI